VFTLFIGFVQISGLSPGPVVWQLPHLCPPMATYTNGCISL